MDQGDYYFADGGFEETNCEEILGEEMARKDRDLMDWLNEFMQSEEFAEHFERKKRRKNKKIQVKEELIEEATKDTQTEEVHTLHETLKRTLKKKHVPFTLANQQLGINIIREKIYEAKRKFLMKSGEKEYLEKNDREGVVKILQKIYGIDLPWLNTKSKLVDRVLCVKKNKSEAVERKRRNTLAIVDKLLNELKREKALKEKKEKVWDYKKSEGKIVEGLEIVGSKVTLYERPEEAIVGDEVEEVIEDLDLEVFQEKTKKKKDTKSPKKGKLDKEKKKSKKDKKGKGKDKKKGKGKDKKSKKSDKKSKKKGKGKDQDKVVIPVPPVTNKREKILGESWDVSKMLKDFDKLQEFLIDQRDYEIEKMMEDRLSHEVDHEIEATPSKIIFKNFINGKTYQMRIHLKNTSSYVKKLRFDKIIWNADIDDDLLLEVEPVGIQKIITGLSFSFLLRFNPETLQKSTEARLVFLTYKPNSGLYHQYVLYVICTPFCSEVTVSPTVISFDELPIWRAKKMGQKRQNYKLLKVKNSGSKECRIVITKVFNPITIEHEWRNLISIMSIEDSNSQPITSSDLGPEDVREDRFPRNLVQECVENVFNNFRFDRMIFNVSGNSEKYIKVWLRNFEETGFYVETYSLSVYERYPDEKLYCIGNQDLVINAELTGHFLSLVPDLVDFEVCAFDSVYQLSFHIFNPTNLPHNVRIKFPPTLKEYLTCTTRDITVQPGLYHKVHLKFSPRSDFVDYNKKYYDGENDLFEFPVYVTIYTRHFEDTPPMTVDVFVALTNPLGLVIIPQHEDHSSNIENEYLLDLGQCNTNEAVFAELKIQNTSLVPQHYAFIDLPPCVTIHPNFGSGYLHPMEMKNLTLYFQPTKQDLLSLNRAEFGRNTVIFSIAASTVKKLGSIKKQLNMGTLNKKLKSMESYVKNPQKLNEGLKQDIETMCSLLRTNSSLLYPESIPTNSSIIIVDDTTSFPKDVEALKKLMVSQSEVDEKVLTVTQYDETPERLVEQHTVSSEEYTEELSEEETVTDKIRPKYASNRLWLKGCITKTLCEFSHQYAMFPDTPCGSYSVISIELRTLKGVRNCVAHFEIFGNNEEIVIEPNVGDLRYGEKIKLYLVARPETPQHVIEAKAAALKVAEAIEIKRKKLEMKRQLEMEEAANKAKGNVKKNPKKKKKRESSKIGDGDGDGEANIPEITDSMIVVDEKDVIYGYFDYYPAEMCVWRSLEPYVIEANFCCEITYTANKVKTTSEKLHLKAKCRVVQPNFIHDLNLQEIDFGKIAIGTSLTKCITLQNIQRRCIAPKINSLNPGGCFSTLELRDVSLLPEFLLKIPITYTPQTEGDDEDIEFFEIVCEQTTYPLILKGRGVHPLLTFKPEFLVSRVDTTTDCSFEIANLTECPVEINFTKVCELDGIIQDRPAPPKTKSAEPKSKKSGKSKKSSQSEKSSKSKEKNKKKYSENLMDDEIYSLEHFFTERADNDPSLFNVIGNHSQEAGTFVIPAMAKNNFKIKFGLPAPPVKEGKGKGNGKGKKDKKSSKGSKGSKNGKKKGGKMSFHVAKFVITIGKRELLKDLIVIGCLSK